MRLRTYAVAAGATATGVSTALAAAGVLARSDWSAFLPDLVVGIAGAGFISAVIAAVQQHATAVADRRADQTAAYLALLTRVTEVRAFRPDQDGTGILSQLTTSMIVFAEVADQEYPSLPAWFEAERRLILHYFALTMSRWPKDPARSPADAQFKALEPIMKWTKEFSSNVRLWRRGNLSDSDAAEQARSIEAQLRAIGAWDRLG